ncbi:MAG: methyltransferase domain-containing protein [Candidatus Methanomethyliaceae archaeon]|nr:methyltransferase domain-containing protein [Candidatus Methanomethyliaceae archaeon]MCX8170326.1 methyltransferase domain-containing protein [Candidatus Methanomethyliaceae archaeon]MDW7970311.1 methyltransferase domain-containing protein [Nitrososphaerota archaeon]
MIIKVFDEFAEEYDKWYQQNREVFESECRLIKSLELKGFGIEVGVGTGIFAPFSNISIGIDPAINMLKIAKRRGVEVINAVGEAMPFRNDVFDFVIMITTLPFLKDPSKVLDEIRRILKNGGEIAIVDVPKNSKWGRLYEEKKAKGHRFYRFANFYNFEEILEILNRKGFEVIKIRATLRQPPESITKVEDPEDEFKNHGFIGIKALNNKV